MHASQYKDYVLTLLLVKYVSGKYAGKPNALIEVPDGVSLDDMVRLRGDKIIKKRSAVDKSTPSSALASWSEHIL